VDNGVGTNFGVGVGEARPEGPRVGDGVLEEGAASPSHQLGVCGSIVSSLSGVWGGALEALCDYALYKSTFTLHYITPKGFLIFSAVRLPFPASQYVLHTVCMDSY